MRSLSLFLVAFLLSSCTNFGQLKLLGDLPQSLEEVSGMETSPDSDLIWMLNDGGNKPELFGVNTKGKIRKTVRIDAKNRDWEDLTSDSQGNLYIGDFGNNRNDRKNLTILKVARTDLNSKNPVKVQQINFKYPNQGKFPPKKKKRHFDSESFFFFNDSLYIFTKSRVKNDFGKTNLYKIPAKQGDHIAIYISSFNSCDQLKCWITSADISSDGKRVVLLNHHSAWLFTDFTSDDFLSGTATELSFGHVSQKEAVCFKDQKTVYISDEYSHGSGGNLYEFSLGNNVK
ncbi:MAG: hypothetical protein QNJ57_13395 [Flavobacteriaceae bacterium]|nr:hypothetical protein [Flavobacteriaceae bacterium]